MGDSPWERHVESSLVHGFAPRWLERGWKKTVPPRLGFAGLAQLVLATVEREGV